MNTTELVIENYVEKEIDIDLNMHMMHKAGFPIQTQSILPNCFSLGVHMLFICVVLCASAKLGLENLAENRLKLWRI